MKSLKQVIFEATLSKQTSIIFFIAIIEAMAEDFLMYHLFGSQTDSDRILGALSSILVILPFQFLIYTYVPWHLGKKDGLHALPYFAFLQKHFVEWLSTMIRVMIRTFLFFLLLIVPGLIESLRLSMSGYNVFFNKNMNDKSFDPVLASRTKLTWKTEYLTVLFFLVFVFQILLLTTMGERNIFSSTGTRLADIFLTTFLLLAAEGYTYFHFRKFFGDELTSAGD